MPDHMKLDIYLGSTFKRIGDAIDAEYIILK